MDYCKYGCGREGTTQLHNGEWICSKFSSQCPVIKIKNSFAIKNSNKIHKGTQGRTWPSPWKGRTYTDIYGASKGKEIATKISHNLIGKCSGIGATPEIEQQRREKIRSALNKNYANGYRPRAGRCKKIYYISPVCGKVILDGTWEKAFAEYLDSNVYNWKRNVSRFEYIFDGRQRFYTPDFYLIDFDYYIEVKGYETEKDKAKWTQFPYKLFVIKKKEFNLLKQGSKLSDLLMEDGGVGLSHFGANEASGNAS